MHAKRALLQSLEGRYESIHMPVIPVLVTLLLYAIIILAAAGVAPSSVIAQQEEEEKTLQVALYPMS